MSKTFEKNIFEWNDWDEIDTSSFVFHNCTLVSDVGEHKAGSKFDIIMVDYPNSRIVLQVHNKSGPIDEYKEYCYELLPKIGNKISEKL